MNEKFKKKKSSLSWDNSLTSIRLWLNICRAERIEYAVLPF